MNVRLTSVGFYTTCIIFFGFQSKPESKTSSNNSLVTTEPARSYTAEKKSFTVLLQQKDSLIKDLKGIANNCSQPVQPADCKK